MRLVTAKGHCESCDGFSEATGGNQEEAYALLLHDHGCEHKHIFQGEPEFVPFTVEVIQAPPIKYTGRKR